MHMYSERTQVLLSPELRSKVETIAARSSISVGAVIRDAIATYRAPASVRKRQEASEELFALEAPVGEWADIEAEIAGGYRR